MLRSYMACFNAVTLKVKDFNEFVTMLALKRELRSSRLSFSLNKIFSRSYVDLLVHVEKYAQVEESHFLY